jgi:hypothetical protein
MRFGGFLEPLAESPVGCYAAANAQSPKARAVERQFGLADKAIDDRLLEARGDVGDFLWR